MWPMRTGASEPPIKRARSSSPSSRRGLGARLVLAAIVVCGNHHAFRVIDGSRQGRGGTMPEKKTLERARKAKREGKSPSTQAGEFVREEIEHVREGKHGARSSKQAIAIGLSKARRAGVRLPPPKRGSRATKEQAARDSA